MTAPAAFAEQPLPAWKRAVLKVGSSLLADDGGLSPRNAQHLAEMAAEEARQMPAADAGKKSS